MASAGERALNEIAQLRETIDTIYESLLSLEKRVYKLEFPPDIEVE